MTDEQEPASSLPPHRTRRISLTKTQLRTELGAELLSLCESVTADGNLTPEEAQALRQWLDDSAAADLPAATYLREIVQRVIADGEITREECREVYRAVEAVLPPEVRRLASAARRDAESAERAASKAELDRTRELERVQRRRNVPIASANFMVAGCRYEGRPDVIRQYANVRDPIRLRRDIGNRYSRNAIAVELKDGHQIGFVPEDFATDLAPVLDDGARCAAYITKILGGGRHPIPVVQAHLYSADSTVDDPLTTIDAPPAVSSAPTDRHAAPSNESNWSTWIVGFALVAGVIALVALMTM